VRVEKIFFIDVLGLVAAVPIFAVDESSRRLRARIAAGVAASAFHQFG
jgi:hypothetical protein